MKLLIGLMSGTSMDGIDAALIDVTTNTLIRGITCPYGDEVAQKLAKMMSCQQTTPVLMSQLNTLIGREFAEAVFQLLETAHVSSNDIIAIGSHGQTICHDAFAAPPYTLQLGCAHTIAALTGIQVVADFRTRDLVLGGQGAPFAPIYHQALFKHLKTSIAVVNIGGIANVTYLSQDGQVAGYDMGPGNCLLDAWAKKHIDKAYDAHGEWAMTGQVNEALLQRLLADPFFQLPPPKSIGKEYFSLEWLASYLNKTQNPSDVQATLVALTAMSIAEEIKANHLGVVRVLICGGGVHNAYLLKTLRGALPHLRIDSTSIFGADPDYIEAMMFAWLAEQTLNDVALDFTKITGAKKRVIVGAVYKA